MGKSQGNDPQLVSPHDLPPHAAASFLYVRGGSIFLRKASACRDDAPKFVIGAGPRAARKPCEAGCVSEVMAVACRKRATRSCRAGSDEVMKVSVEASAQYLQHMHAAWIPSTPAIARLHPGGGRFAHVPASFDEGPS